MDSHISHWYFTCMHQGTSQKITSLIKSATAITTDILIWCHFFLPLILATYNDYITLCFHFVIPFGFIFNFFITDIIPLVLPRKKLTGLSLPYLGLLTCPMAILMMIYARLWQIWCQKWSTLYRFWVIIPFFSNFNARRRDNVLS